MDRIWFVVADEGRARVLERAQPGAALHELQELHDELARARGTELGRDAKGRLFGKGERFMGHTTEPRTDPHRKGTRLTDAQMKHYKAGRLAANVRTGGHPKGELRAQLHGKTRTQAMGNR